MSHVLWEYHRELQFVPHYTKKVNSGPALPPSGRSGSFNSMQILCHRCGEAAASRDQAGDVTSFCPHCGAPQLLFEADDAPALDDVSDTGQLSQRQTRPRLVDWRAAIGVAAIVGAGAALLCAAGTRLQLFGLLTWIWITSASLIALGLYRRRRPQARMDAAIGARIGVVVGLALTVGLASSLAVIGMLARYALHAMAPFDAQITIIKQDSIQRAVASGVDAATLASMRGFYASPEVVSGGMLFGFMLLLGGLILYSIIAGALGGMMHTRRNAIS